MRTVRMMAVLVLASFLAGGCCSMHEIAVKSVPPEVQKTIDLYAEGGTVRELEKENEHGMVLYRAEIRKADGTEIQVTVTDGGKLYELERE